MADTKTQVSNIGVAGSIGALGKFERPINMIIEEETNLCRQKSQFDKLLYNVAKSDKFSEAYFLENELDLLTAVTEGNKADAQAAVEKAKKYIDHMEFKGDCILSRTLIEDSNRNEISKRVRKLVRSYWATRNKFAQVGLFNGTSATVNFATQDFDLTTADGKPLFSKEHPILDATQANYFHCVETSWDSSAVAELLAALAVKGRQMLSENGEPMGYTFNKIIIPGNTFKLEKAVREVIGTPYSPGNDHNNINIVHGGWQLVVLPAWTADSNKIIIMSDEANENLGGSMFYDRMPFDVQKDLQFDRNDELCLHGRARMSLVHNTYKHVIMCDLCTSDPTSPTSEEISLSETVSSGSSETETTT